MVQSSNTLNYSTEIFNIISEKLPRLYAYKLITRGSNQQVSSGRKLADRLKRIFQGHWVWTSELIVTDTSQSAEAIEQAIKNIRIKEKDVFKDLSGIKLSENWQPLPQAYADFVAQCLLVDLGQKIQDVLQPSIDLDKAYVERDVDIRGWVVKNKPTVSLSIDSRVIYKDDLKTYLRQLSSPEEMVGIWVCDKVPFETGKFLKGEIISIEGKLDETISRDYLIDITQRETSKPIIQKADKGEIVVRVLSGNNEYQYVVSALRIVLFTKHYRRYGIDTKKAQDAVWIAPSPRWDLVKRVLKVASSSGLIEDKSTSHGTMTPKVPSYDSTILLGKKKQATGAKIAYEGGTSLIKALSENGLYQYISNVGMVREQPLHIGIINTSTQQLDKMKEALENQLKELGFPHLLTSIVKTNGKSRVDFERAINELQSKSPHIIVAIILDSDSVDEDDWGPYYDFKSLIMNTSIPSQVIDQKTLQNAKALPYVMQNMSLGMVSKMGNIPYILANQSDYADIVVGIDIARKRNKSGNGSQNAAAIAQIYHKTGQFSRCKVVETPLEGETVPEKILRSLFPLNEFEKKKVIIHRDGLLRGNEEEIIADHMRQLGGEAYFVEVVKSGSPRIYASANGQLQSPGIGTSFIISDTEAFLVASESFKATPQPLQIRTRAPFTIGKALHSVLMLTLMHYGSVKRPKLPISIHYSDKIGYLALRGVKPVGGQSTDMYWL